jgi:hypothetical protein
MGQVNGNYARILTSAVHVYVEQSGVKQEVSCEKVAVVDSLRMQIRVALKGVRL